MMVTMTMKMIAKIQIADHLIIDEDVLEEREALAPLDQLVQPLVGHHRQSLHNVLPLAW